MNELRIWVLVPTRGHAEGVERLYRDMRKTTKRPELVTLVLGYDLEDSGERFVAPVPRCPEVVVHEQCTTGAAAQIRAMAQAYPGPEDLLKICADHFRFLRAGWDDIAREEAPVYEPFQPGETSWAGWYRSA